MEITSNCVKTICDAEVRTAQAHYVISYTVKDGELVQAIVQVRVDETVSMRDGAGNMVDAVQETGKGLIQLSYGNVTLNNFPYSDAMAGYVSDFVGIISQLKGNIRNGNGA